MKSVIEYLEDQRDINTFQCYHFSTSSLFDAPKPGYEKEYEETMRERDIINELIAMVKRKNA
jgi:retron-type reverse transcriptase